jgi:type IV secretory pathway VirB2 component (pilin)
MAKAIAASAAEEAPVAAPITAEHRASAAARGVSIDGVVAALRQSLGEGVHAISAIIGAAPEGDGNLMALKSLHRQLLHAVGAVDVFAPSPGRTHTLFDGRR